MKIRSILVSAALAFLSPLAALADLSMVILSETYHVSGYVRQTEGEDWFGNWWPAVDIPYDYTDNDPVGGGVEQAWPCMYAHSDAGRGVSPYESEANGYCLYLDAYRSKFFYDSESYLDTYSCASIEIDFMLTGPDDSLAACLMGTAHTGSGGFSHAELTNRNTSESWPLSASSLVPVNETDLYRLEISAYERSTYGTEISLEFLNVSSVDVPPIPSVALLYRTIDIVSRLGPGSLINRNRDDPLGSKLEATITLIEAELYEDALMKLQHDILPKTDGCALKGRPDDHDWITTSEAQQKVCPLVLEAISLLEELI